jgi:UDP-N-acetylglucosamine--N-acetylmuramyl-(pentapeptide) pyrophosphoryl-undecaprenol N-acetylglucosamine transferase
MKLFKVIISGGGTGGHIFPALAIANELKEQNPAIEILFVGANGKMEMEKVPNAGYKIIGLDVVGIQRSLSFNAIIKNLKFPFLLLKSLKNAKSIVRDFNPDIVIGVGGYASGPTLKMANKLKVPTLIQEQNSYAGLTNKWLSTNASKICVAYDKMDKFFPEDKIIKTGNPVRKDILELSSKIKEAKDYFDLKNEEKVILVLGGSLGARSINNGLLSSLKHIKDKPVRLLWQVGSRFHEDVTKGFSQQEFPNVSTMAFIKRMDLAYAAADIIISRAGALSISEITLVGKASMLIPSPNVSEDHQTKNAMALVDENAAILVKDNATNTVLEKAMELLDDQNQSKLIAKNAKKLARPNATADIVSEIFKLIK